MLTKGVHLHILVMHAKENNKKLVRLFLNNSNWLLLSLWPGGYICLDSHQYLEERKKNCINSEGYDPRGDTHK